VTVADPKATPVTIGCVAGVVAPAGIVTVDVTVSFVVSVLVSVMVSPPGGAGEDRVTAMGAVCPGATVTFEAKPIAPNWETRMLALPLV
jgi:hypothetical protein